MTKKLEPPPADYDKNPEWTDEDFARARPFKEMFPEQFRSSELSHQQERTSTIDISFRLAVDVLEGIRATGPGYNARVEKVLREALAKGEF